MGESSPAPRKTWTERTLLPLLRALKKHSAAIARTVDYGVLTPVWFALFFSPRGRGCLSSVAEFLT